MEGTLIIKILSWKIRFIFEKISVQRMLAQLYTNYKYVRCYYVNQKKVNFTWISRKQLYSIRLHLEMA